MLDLEGFEARLQRFTTEIGQALLRVENRQREELKLPLFALDTPVYMPRTKQAVLLLYNLKVWSERYAVPLDFLLEQLLIRFRNNRKNIRADRLNLGIPTLLLTSVSARQHVERAVRSQFPNQENVKSQQQPPAPLPIRGLRYEDDLEMVASYGEEMMSRQRQALRKVNYRRNFRRAPVQWS